MHVMVRWQGGVVTEDDKSRVSLTRERSMMGVGIAGSLRHMAKFSTACVVMSRVVFVD